MIGWLLSVQLVTEVVRNTPNTAPNIRVLDGNDWCHSPVPKTAVSEECESVVTEDSDGVKFSSFYLKFGKINYKNEEKTI